MVRAKFKLNAITDMAGWSAKKMVFDAVCNSSTEENKSFAKYTPSGRLEITVDNPSALEQFKLGGYYYLDFSEAPA